MKAAAPLRKLLELNPSIPFGHYLADDASAGQREWNRELCRIIMAKCCSSSEIAYMKVFYDPFTLRLSLVWMQSMLAGWLAGCPPHAKLKLLTSIAEGKGEGSNKRTRKAKEYEDVLVHRPIHGPNRSEQLLHIWWAPKILPSHPTKKTFIQSKWGVSTENVFFSTNIRTCRIFTWCVLQERLKKLNYPRGIFENWIDLPCRSFVHCVREYTSQQSLRGVLTAWNINKYSGKYLSFMCLEYFHMESDHHLREECRKRKWVIEEREAN